MDFENTFKAIKKTDTELRIGNYIILFGSRDLEFLQKGRNADGSLGEYFVPTVDVDSEYTRKGALVVDFEHRDDPQVQNSALGYVDWSTATRDEKGIFVQRVLDRRNQYVRMLEELIDAGLIGNSSEAVRGKTKTQPDGGITVWPLYRDTLTVAPSEPRMLTENQVRALKSISSVVPAAKALLDTVSTSNRDSGGAKGGAKKGAAACRTQPGKQKSGSDPMNILEAIKKLLPGLKPEQYDQIAVILGLTGFNVGPAPEENAVDDAGNPVKSVTMVDLITSLKGLGYTVALPGQAAPKKTAAVRPPFETKPTQPGAEADPEEEAETARKKSVEAAYMVRFGDEDSAKKAILSDVVGADYRAQIHEQNVAYARYLRGGERALESSDAKALRRQIFPLDQIVYFVKNGMDVKSIKAVQIESQGELGGYAIPPNIQSEISTRLPGLTIVRQSGARVVVLAQGNSIDIPQYVSTDTTKRYVGNLRGEWGNETKAPGEQNFKLKMVSIIANLYTYKVPFSMTLVEDAANLVSLVTRDMTDTAAIDEDECFLVGDGVGKPLGLLPSGSNSLGLSEVISGSAADLTGDQIKALKRGVAAQYRKNCVFVANSDTYGAIEKIKDGEGRYMFPDLTDDDMLLSRKAMESEAMPDIAANTFPLLFGDMSGYTIIERLGMTIERFHDSGTGINKVEYHLRRRIGGRMEQPWKFDVQKVAAA